MKDFSCNDFDGNKQTRWLHPLYLITFESFTFQVLPLGVRLRKQTKVTSIQRTPTRTGNRNRDLR